MEPRHYLLSLILGCCVGLFSVYKQNKALEENKVSVEDAFTKIGLPIILIGGFIGGLLGFVLSRFW